MKVGVIGQTMRMTYCRSYFAEPAAAPAVILTDDAGAFADWDLPRGVEIVGLVDESVSLRQRLRRRMRRRAIEWARSGSVIGTRVEKAARRFRPPPRIVLVPEVGTTAPLRLGLIRYLDALQEKSGIEEIVVFDLLDLPSVLEFSTRTEVPVIVR
jgi:hypothetical protein